jgi:flagellar M-ring protein FliF
MKETVTRLLGRGQDAFKAFTTGQKVVAVIGTAALLLAGFLVFRWASTPSYAPLYTNLESSDASAVIDELDSKNVAYKITDGGSTIMVPQKDVYATRIALSGDGVPSGSGDSGYSILDKQGLSTSDFQEQTGFKRAMETELSKTVEAINGVDTAVVHLAMPQKQVFSDKQDPTTASVLVKMRAGQTLGTEQVQAVVNLVASSIDGLKPENVTVADSTGKVLSAAGAAGATTGTATQAQDVADFQDRMSTTVTQMLDRVLGPGNSDVQVTADLDFDKAVTEDTRYFYDPKVPALSAASTTEEYAGLGPAGTSGVVGPDGQMDTATTGTTGVTGTGGKYRKVVKSSDNAVGKRVEQREAAPGNVKSLHVGVVVDTLAAGTIAPGDLQNLIAAALGIDEKRGDTVNVSTMPFNRDAEKQAKADLAAADKAAAATQRYHLLRNAGVAAAVLLVLLLLWLRSRKQARQRQEATTYVVEQLRRDAADRAAAELAAAPSPATMALEARDRDLSRETREEIAALVERQPEDVAALLRGWLVDKV